MIAGGERTLNVVCVKWGDKYPAYYVNRLYSGVTRYLDRPFSFHCFTDNGDDIDPRVRLHDLPVEPFESELQAAMQRKGRKGAWRKISLFRPGLGGMEGQILGFDLDVVITGRLEPLVDAAPDKVAMRHEWRYEWKGQPGGHGSVFVFDPALHRYLYNDFAADPVGSVERNKGSEQYYTSMSAFRRGQLHYLPGSMVCSFKYDAARIPPLNLMMEPRLPLDCRVMCFHGSPKMEEAVEGFEAGLLRSTRPASWLKRHWRV
ncbi:hypothetical protein [Devosia sp.]|uniref:hypothetical protein n=1 Tax=Devosia sp. TaxID=1871048 RepID=UPI003BAB42F3